MFLLKETTDEQAKPSQTNLIKQKSHLWKSVPSLTERQKYCPAASWHSRFKGPKGAFDVNVLEEEPVKVSGTTQRYLDHDTRNEIIAVATLSEKIFLIFYTELN